jgi:biopolymer transport protein ExbD
MARKSRLEDPQDEDVNLTPMLDVTFILLIFFIVTAQFVKEPGAIVQRETAKTAKATKPAILIAIDAQDQIWINREIYQIKEVKAIVQDMREDNPLGDAVIQVDRDSESGIMLEVLTAVRAAGVDTINVATEDN